MRDKAVVEDKDVHLRETMGDSMEDSMEDHRGEATSGGSPRIRQV